MASPLLALVPSLIKGAIQIFTDRKAFSENLTTKTTAAAGVTGVLAAVAPEVLPTGGDETQLALAITTIILFLLRKYG